MSTESRALVPPAQHLRALARANDAEQARQELKRKVTEGELRAADVVAYCPWEAASMSVSELLNCQRGWGRRRTRKVLQSIPMSENKTLGSMTERQRSALSSLIGDPDQAVRPETTKASVASTEPEEEVTSGGVAHLDQVSKLLFGSRLRLPVAVAVADMPVDAVNALAIARLLGSPPNLIGVELGRLVDVGLLVRLAAVPGEKGVYYSRRESAYWDLVKKLVGELIARDGP